MNGIFTRRELKIEIYDHDNDSFIIVTNDKMADEPIVLTGGRAEQAICSLLDEIAKQIRDN